MPTLAPEHITENRTDPRWNILYKVGGWATLIIPLMYIITGVITMRGYRSAPFPENVNEWFTVLQNSPLTGLFYLGFADIIITIVSGLMTLALYVALKRAGSTLAIIARTLRFRGDSRISHVEYGLRHAFAQLPVCNSDNRGAESNVNGSGSVNSDYS